MNTIDEILNQSKDICFKDLFDIVNSTYTPTNNRLSASSDALTLPTSLPVLDLQANATVAVPNAFSIFDDDIKRVSTTELAPATKRQRVCGPTCANRVYITPPTVTNESMEEFGQRAGFALMVLKAYNPMILENATVPPNTCFMTWEHSAHNASCFELIRETPCQLQTHDADLSQLFCDHASTIHVAIGSNSRIANDCEFVPAHAQCLTQTLLRHGTVTLDSTLTYRELVEQNKDLLIDWDTVSKNTRQFPAEYVNKRNERYTFYFEKHLQNGKCKGLQDINTGVKMHSYTNSAGLSLDKIRSRAGTTFPTLLHAKQHSVASCDEVVVDKNVDTMHLLTSVWDSRTLYIDKCIHSETDRHGYIYTRDTKRNATVEVGVWTKNDRHMCCTLYHTLSRVIVKNI